MERGGGEERRVLYGINGHTVRLCRKRERREDGLLRGGCGGGGRGGGWGRPLRQGRGRGEKGREGSW